MARARTAERRGSVRVRQAPEVVGARVRALRLDAGLTQAELGGERFTKEYVSQVELGKTRPSAAAIAWFTARLAVDRSALEGEAGPAAVAASAAVVARAEASVEARRYPEAVTDLERVQGAVRSSGDAHLALRHGVALGWALHHLGRLEDAATVLGAAAWNTDKKRGTLVSSWARPAWGWISSRSAIAVAWLPILKRTTPSR